MVASVRGPRVIVLGAGASGLAMGIALKRAGLENFRILEAESGLGGTWRVNRYPGAAVDIPSSMYQFGFRTHRWRRTHATAPEVLEYLEEVAREYELTPDFTYDTRVSEMRWNDAAHEWTLATAAGRSFTADVVVSAVGLLSNAKLPEWPGIEDFAGKVVHTALWDDDLDLRGARVAVVGAGSSSAQVVPAIAPGPESVTVFQREPGWVLPKGDHEFTAAELARNSRSRRRTWERMRLITRKEWANHTGKPTYVAGSKRNRAAEAVARAHIDEVFADRPDLRAAVTPDYPFEGKRIVQSSDYYKALLRNNVRLVPHAVRELTPDSVVDVEGTKHEVDVVITATGFTASTFLAGLEVYGRGGRRLLDTWVDGAYAYLGMTVPNYPNFYLQFGPNTNGAGAGSLFWDGEQPLQAPFGPGGDAVRRQHHLAVAAVALRAAARHLPPDTAVSGGWRKLLDPELVCVANAVPPTDFSDPVAFRQSSATATAAKAAEVDQTGVTVDDLADVRVRLYRPRHSAGLRPAILHLRGGGFVSGSPDSSHARMVQLCRNLGVVIVSVDYRLSPVWRGIRTLPCGTAASASTAACRPPTSP